MWFTRQDSPSTTVFVRLESMGKKSRVKRLRRQQITAAQQVLTERVQRSLPDDRCKIVKRRTGRKVSEILMEFAEPWLDQVETDDQRRKVIGMAVLAWNMARLADSDRPDRNDSEIAEKLGEAGMSILNEMIGRKVALYPEERRVILDFEFTADSGRMRVDVVTSLSPEEMADLKQDERKPGAAT
jgi:hypothetical protein